MRYWPVVTVMPTCKNASLSFAGIIKYQHKEEIDKLCVCSIISVYVKSYDIANLFVRVGMTVTTKMWHRNSAHVILWKEEKIY